MPYIYIYMYEHGLPQIDSYRAVHNMPQLLLTNEIDDTFNLYTRKHRWK